MEFLATDCPRLRFLLRIPVNTPCSPALRLLAITFVCSLIPAAGGDEVAFRRDVMAVISKAGCNAGSCHGNANGKGGFKLSLRGQDPDLDWTAMTREQGGRRVNLIEPEKSLLLLKATAGIAHEGGQRFSSDSPEHTALLAWLRAGAPDSTASALRSLEVTPNERVLVAPEVSAALARGGDVRRRIAARRDADGRLRAEQ